MIIEDFELVAGPVSRHPTRKLAYLPKRILRFCVTLADVLNFPQPRTVLRELLEADRPGLETSSQDDWVHCGRGRKPGAVKEKRLLQRRRSSIALAGTLFPKYSPAKRFLNSS